MIANTKFLEPGTTGEVGFMASRPEGYEFLCTFPSHNVSMLGYFIVSDPATEIAPQRSP
ncbi:uncharacterized protein METZ01_LOCUS144944 [marine metagenome]|uniref:Blue (type 1) copper domain-containing protein n=1 Tax=marine metagenome TaxID=408172 RepID=A0A381ZS81_9ZZZZ|tara:strand:+ start:172 stop:348 length:177 start_codon:yes stop_codon:yes gene_type:complete